MAIRIREVNGYIVAICAARTFAKEGDLYLDDGVHYALSTKFGLDWYKVGFIDDYLADKELSKLMENEEVEDNGYNEIKTIKP